eukprot:761251-Hanusia_phi.AAC.3
MDRRDRTWQAESARERVRDRGYGRILCRRERAQVAEGCRSEFECYEIVMDLTLSRLPSLPCVCSLLMKYVQALSEAEGHVVFVREDALLPCSQPSNLAEEAHPLPDSCHLEFVAAQDILHPRRLSTSASSTSPRDPPQGPTADSTRSLQFVECSASCHRAQEVHVCEFNRTGRENALLDEQRLSPHRPVLRSITGYADHLRCRRGGERSAPQGLESTSPGGGSHCRDSRLLRARVVDVNRCNHALAETSAAPCRCLSGMYLLPSLAPCR